MYFTIVILPCLIAMSWSKSSSWYCKGDIPTFKRSFISSQWTMVGCLASLISFSTRIYHTWTCPTSFMIANLTLISSIILYQSKYFYWLASQFEKTYGSIFPTKLGASTLDFLSNIISRRIIRIIHFIVFLIHCFNHDVQNRSLLLIRSNSSRIDHSKWWRNSFIRTSILSPCSPFLGALDEASYEVVAGFLLSWETAPCSSSTLASNSLILSIMV